MADAPEASSLAMPVASGKKTAKAKGSGGEDGKKRFEVKKVGYRAIQSKITVLILLAVERCCSLGLGYRS